MVSAPPTDWPRVFVTEADGKRPLTSSQVINGWRVWRQEEQERMVDDDALSFRTTRTTYWVGSPEHQYPSPEEAMAAATVPPSAMETPATP